MKSTDQSEYFLEILTREVEEVTSKKEEFIAVSVNITPAVCSHHYTVVDTITADDNAEALSHVHP